MTVTCPPAGRDTGHGGRQCSGGAAGVVLAGREDWHLPSLSPRCLDSLLLLRTGAQNSPTVTLLLHEEVDNSGQDPILDSNDRLVTQTRLSVHFRQSSWPFAPHPLQCPSLRWVLTQARSSILEEGKARGTGSWDRLFHEKVRS